MKSAQPWLTLTVLLISACSSSHSVGHRSTAPLPTPPATVAVELTEYHFGFGRIPAGRVVIRIHNAGNVQHYPRLLRLDEDMPPIAEQLSGQTRRIVPPFAEVPPRDPGRSGTFAVDLEAGHRYAFVCFAASADGTPHYLKGMASEFRAGQP